MRYKNIFSCTEILKNEEKKKNIKFLYSFWADSLTSSAFLIALR